MTAMPMAERLRGFFRFERLLAALLTLLPIGLLFADTDYRAANCPGVASPPDPLANCRDSFSAYHDMADAMWYFIPLTMAAVMFIVNGLVRDDGHAHNTWLGFALLGVLLFDHENEFIVHYVFAVIFFVSAIVFISAYAAGTLRMMRSLALGSTRLLFIGLAAAQTALFVALWLFTSLFVAEWVQLVIISLQFIWHSIAHEDDHHGTADPEPIAVLEDLLGPIYTVARLILTPVTALWSWIQGSGSH